MYVVLPCVNNSFLFQDIFGAGGLWSSAPSPDSTTLAESEKKLSSAISLLEEVARDGVGPDGA